MSYREFLNKLLIGESSGSGGASSWDEITGKPSTFTPAAHSHSVAEVTGLQTALDGKSAAGHTHTAAEVAGLAAALSGKVSSVNGATPDSSGAVTIPEATSGAAGLMSAADKTKLDGLDTIDIAESRLLPDSGPDDSWMHHSESMDLVTPADMTSMQSADWTLTAENVQENFSAKPWGLFNSGSYGFNIDGSGPATCTWTRRDGTPTLIDRLKIYTSSPGNNNGDSYEFYGSQDGNNWTLLGSWSAKWNSDSVKDTETNLNVLTLEVSNSTKYLYYKFSANSPTLDRLKGYGVTTKNEWKKFPVATASTAGLMAAADKAKLDGLGTASSWYTVAYAAVITPDRANGELQKVTLTGDCTLTAPTLSAETPTLLLQVSSSSAVTVTVGETAVVSGKSGTWQIGWYWDGEATRRYPAVEVA